jgi:hypothetical protein
MEAQVLQLVLFSTFGLTVVHLSSQHNTVTEVSNVSQDRQVQPLLVVNVLQEPIEMVLLNTLQQPTKDGTAMLVQLVKSWGAHNVPMVSSVL